MLRKVFSVLLASVCLITFVPLTACADNHTYSIDDTVIVTAADLPFESTSVSVDMRDISTMELVREMGIGINLGNTMESCGDWIAQWGDGTVASYETTWGSPVITKEIIQGYADEGFGVLRIPVGWSNLMGENIMTT